MKIFKFTLMCILPSLFTIPTNIKHGEINFPMTVVSQNRFLLYLCVCRVESIDGNEGGDRRSPFTSGT